MKYIQDFLFELKQKNIELWAEDGQLRFKAPKGALTESLRAELGARKSEILEFLHRKALLEQPIPRLAEGEKIPLSFAQQRLLFLEQLEEQRAVYNMPAVFHCAGQLDENALQASLAALIQRHASLRTYFLSVNGEATAQVGEVYNPLHITDLSALDEAARQAEVDRLIVEHAQLDFDLRNGPLFDLLLLKRGEGQPLLLFNMHHIITDGWSISVFIREWKALYNAYLQGQEAALPELPIQYGDYAAWQRQWLAQGLFAGQLEYWKNQLAGLPDLLELPTDFPRPALMGTEGNHCRVTIPSELAQKIKQLSRDQGATLFMTLLAAFNALLYRYSRQEDFAVGSPIANRTHPQSEGLIGFFVNALVLRAQLSAGQSFLELLQQTRQTALDAYSHQDIPFDYLVEQLNPTRNMRHAPLFQVMFALQNTPQEDLELGGVKLTLQQPDYHIAKFDLSLSVTEQAEGLQCDWEYRADLFRPETITRMTGHFQRLLEEIAANPARPISRLPWLTEANAQQLTAWNQTQMAYPAAKTVVNLFEAQAAQNPCKTALVFVGQQLGYAELNQRANQLAYQLIELGVEPDTLVGICVERSLDMITGLLGILKAGGAYVPLDPDYPQERLAFMIEDAGVEVLVTQSHLLARLPKQITASVCLDRADLDAYPNTNPPRRASPGHLAYIIYTSGSTGKPKGVMIEHAALAAYVHTAIATYGLQAQDRVLQFSSINFDVSVEEIYPILIQGGCLVVRDNAMLNTDKEFLQACEQQAISVIMLPTAYWQQLIHSQGQWPAGLRTLIIGGEAAAVEQVRYWLRELRPTARLFNAYGPTETTVSSVCYRFGSDIEEVCPIGQPLPNQRVYLLDAQLQPVPPGVPGELCIAGTGLARGYLHRPDLTAEKFIELELFRKTERIYKTGDLARWLPDGNLEYLGRIDQQVKLRGFRIELGEIEAALNAHPVVIESAVVLREREGDKILAAYVTAASEKQAATQHSPLATTLRDWLKTRLPDYMIPASFTVLDKLPLTSNGKIDRKALPAPEMQSRDTTRLIKPKTALEQKIAAVWRKVLKLEQVGIQDNFFDLGGHSLLLLQVLSQLQETLNLSLPLVTLFQYPTIQSLAAHLASDKATAPILGADTAQRDNPPNDHADDIAIIGMAGRFPGAADIDAFWENLRNGVESIQFFSDEELLASGIDPQVFNHPHYVRAGGVIEQPEYFDAAFFGFPPSEAELLDPQQRLFMETAWTAIEHAGYDVNRMPFAVGIFAGAGASSYFLNNLWPNQALLARFGQQQVLMSGDKDFLAARVAYKLNLRGPVVSLHTACSTSLVAVHIARQSLLQNECRMALAGGVTVFFPHKQGYMYQEGMILSPDGHCRPFDANAKGSVGGAGVAAVVLKRLSHALEDGDSIHAVIKGSAINNDGMARVGFTAPSVEGQSQVIRDAMRGLDYESISYIETHGTATLLGDPIEISALQKAYTAGAKKSGYCALGAVKANIGHLDTAAGIAGLIKTAQALKHREIPPTLHFKTPNPQIDFANSPFFVNTELKLWHSEAPRRAGVSSFGIGGTNAHVVLEEAPAQESSASRAWQLICLSAKSETALHQYRKALAEHLSKHPGLKLADVAYTFNTGRGAFAHRGFIVGCDAAEMAAQLGQEKSRHWQRGRAGEQDAQVVFMFPGQGSQYINMARGLYQQVASFRTVVDECAKLLRPHLQLDIRELIYPSSGAATDIRASLAAQPALFVIEYALAKLCMAWGIQPAAMIGHSIGEYVAACLAGVFSLPDALQLIAIRGGLMQGVPQGEMLGILLPKDEVEALLPADVFIAAHNAPSLVSVSGSPDSISRFSEQLQARRVMFSRLQTLNAAHSPVMQPVLQPLREQLRKITLNPPQRPYISNLTGDWITAEQATSVEYWSEHLLKPVQFSTGIQTLVAHGADILLEVGPEMVLTSFAQQHRPQYQLSAFNLLRTAASTQDDLAWTLGALGQLWLRNVSIDWAAFYEGEQRLRLPLPTYPFERQRYWIEPVRRLPSAPLVGTVDENAPPVATGADQSGCGCPTYLRPDINTEYVAPNTVTESKVANIWQQLLGIAPIGIHDDFFRLGGNSLLGAQVLSRLREAFAAEIPLNILFQHPVLEELANWLDSQHGAADASFLPILPQSADAPLVMSFAQQRLRFLAQLEGESATYNLPGVVHLTGKLNENALRKAFTALILRHDSLRLSFPVINGEARVCKGDVYDPVDIQDISKLPAAEQQEIRKAWLTRHAQAPFNLDTGPLLRLHVLTLNAEEQIALINMHHIISDGWTIGLLIHEWSQCYNAYAQNRQPELPALPIQYTDYAAWQRQWLQGEVLERQLGYWKQKLADAPALLELPTDYPRPAIMRYQGSYLRFAVDSALTQQIKQFSQDQGVTIFMTLLAAFKVLLYRYSGQQDLQVGTPIAGRTRRETEGLIGFFVNTLVLRSVIAGEESFLQLLQQVKQTELEAHEHQDIPFEYLVEKLNPARSLSHSPLFQVMFALQNAPEYALQLDGLQARLLESEASTSKFDLTLSIEEREQSFICHWEYNTDLFRPETIARMHEHWQTLLRSILADPRLPVARLPLLMDADVHQLMAWNDTVTDCPRDQTVVKLFEASVNAAPDGIAVVFEGQSLTYQQLNTQANQLAHALIALGVSADTLVAICAQRSPEMIIGMLAILKAGGAYVPLDPDYPAERLQFMLEDCQAPVLLTQTWLQERLPASDACIVYLDEAEIFAGQSTNNPAPLSGPGDLAYVIYTSGSTGRPKGVMLEHHGAVNLAIFQQRYFHSNANSRILQFASLSFDAATWEVLMSLCSGAALQLVPINKIHTELGIILQRQKITHATLPPSVVHALPSDDFSNLQYLIVAGEACSPELVKQWAQPGRHFINAYGPTETTICASVFACTPNGKQPPIGRPIANTRIYILDNHHQPQPIGVPGELCIAGAGLARGYLNRPELTAEKFIEIELCGQTERIYKTGDLARWLPDGNLEYLGRIDHQIKLRGFRIELGEIESVLAQHEAVKEVVVTLYEADGNKRMMAYVVESGQNPLPILQLRDWLKTRLPDYMIPAHFVVLDKLPLTPNGKIDRKALPAPERESETGVLPLTPSEELLAALWSAVLTVKTIHRHANFFELGGHSLLATQLVSRVREAFQTELPVRQLFETPVLSDLAAWLDRQQRGEILPPLQPLPEFAPLRLSAAQERLWFLAKLEGPSATYNIPAAVRLHGKLDIDALRQTFALLTERHQSLRMYFPEIDGQSTLKLLPAYDSLQIIDLSSLAEDQQADELQSEILRHGATPFDLATGPLLQHKLLVLGPSDHILLFNMHHIISDGWSMAILLRESAAIYKAIAAGQPPVLKPLPAQYADYAAWQRAVLTGDTLARRIAWWKEYLAGMPPLLELPTDHPRPVKQSFRGATLQSGIGAELTRRLQELAQQQGCTLFMTLLAAFSVLLQRHSGQSDIVIGSPIANRAHSQTEDIIGFFINVLALRTQIDPEQSFTGLLRQTRHSCLGAYAHQDTPFEMLVEQLQPTRSLGHSPLFQVMLALQNNASETFELSGLTVTSMPVDYPMAKFDLTLNVEEKGGQLQCHWEYATDLFQAETIERMAGHFAVLLHGIVDNPGQSLGLLPLLTEAELQQLAAWNDTAAEYPKDKTIVDLFEEQVEKTPDNIAVVFEEKQLSYAELNKKANQLAHYLRQHHAIAPDTLIAICVERSLEMVVGLLAILKSGGAYVPLDPDYPSERLRFMLEDSRAPVLLTQTWLQERLPASDARIVYLDEAAAFAGQSCDNPASLSGPGDLAYVLFTSGSTGRPKGVMIKHSNATALLSWSITALNPRYFAGTLASTSINFDLSVFELFVPLCFGGKVILAQNALYLPTLTHQQEIKLINTVPSAIAELIRMNAIPESVEVVCLAGEPLKKSIVSALYQLPQIEAVYNLYGPSEDTTYSTYSLVPRDTEPHIGRPIANTRIYILDAHHQPQPIGVPGELCIAGAGLARGYLNRPELTAEKFVEIELFGEKQRMYKTGDLVRWLPDGNLEYLGRIDHQIKLRGFRIELGEIEAALTQHQAVKEAVVTIYEADGNKWLVAYVTLNNNDEFITHHSSFIIAIRAWLKTRLTEYMVPAHFVALDKLPLNPNGKIDRKALPEPERHSEAGPQPMTPTEELLAALWNAALKVEVIHRHDNFFELGGHSLLATQLVSRVREAFQTELPVRQLFETPVLSDLAAYLDQAGRATRLPPITKQPAGAEGALSFAQQRLWFLAHLEGQNAAYNMPFALKLRGQLQIAVLRQATTALIQRHESLRVCFQEVGGIGAVASIPFYDPFNVIDLSVLDDAEQAQQVNTWLARHGKDAFDLTSGPLFSLRLLRLSEQEHVLLCNMHHIISDGWSMGVMVRDWSELYRAAAEQREPMLPELSIQYTDYAAWQKDWLRGETLKAQLSYWRDKLANVPELLDLPTDFPRPAVKTYQGKHLQSTLPVGLADDIKRVSREHGATVFMTLLSAFNVLLYRYSGQTDVLVGSPIANRTQRQTEDLIGFFVNTLVLRSQLDSTQTFVELLQQVRQTALGAYSHQDIPFEFLVEQLNPARSTSYSPLFQVMFILQNTPMEALAFGDIGIEILEPELTTAKFDLTLSMTEVDGGFICDWEYSTDLFEAETILRMAGHFETLLRELMRTPEQAVSAFSLLSPAEAEELQRWNATEFEYPRHQTLVDLFEAQAALHPDKIAVCCTSDKLSFAELNAQANQLAAYLRGLGVGPDTLVGICVERSLEMLVGLLGILKAGGAYVPMDPDYPRERLRVMLDDSAIQILLTQQRLINHLPESGLTLLCLDRDWTAIAGHSRGNLVRSSNPNHLAYVIFTSGSTGRPKGVMIEHGALLNFLSYMQQRIGIRESDRFLALTTLSFDIAGLELYLPLISGSQVMIIPRETAMDGERLMQAMDEQRITIMQATPATWKLLLQSGWQQRAPLTILCGGESMPGELGKKLLENSQQLWNVYGPTETTVWSTMQDCTRHPERTELIGRPIGNTQIYILDEHGCVVPPGMSGELCIGGDGLARGYLNRPELTAEKFVEMDLFGQRQTLYKTGDLARLLRNGHLECLGRIDHQVKLRGFRIELGEIEEALNRHPRLQEAAVISNQAKDSLLAYVVPRSGADADSHDQNTQAEQVKRWEQVWSDTYSQSSTEIKDTQRNTIGWNSSYTLAPIPQAEMQEWLDCTVEQVLTLAPTRILEIGCGTGMLLFRLVPHCEHYTGVDISPAALRWIEQQTQGWAFADRVTLRQAAADQISGIEPGSVDLVIINSVIQYFPSVDYLIRVLLQAVEWVAPGGQIFVGDARNFQLLEAFHASIQWFQAEAELTATQLRQRISASLKRERELLIDPEFFSALQQELPTINQARILLKNGVADNEMTRFRYDAVLSVGAAAQAPDQAIQKLDWSQDALTLDKLSQMLMDHCADILEISGIPNARLAPEQRLLARLEVFEGTVAGLKAEMADDKDGEWVAPESLRALAKDRCYACTLYYGDRFCYTAVLQRVTPELPPYFVTVKAASTPRPWRSYANEPAVELLDKTAFAAELRDYLQQQLPAYMVPSSFTVLDKLPLTPNGKINRKALPEPDAQRRGNAYQPPRDTVELQLAQIWEELLKTHPVGISDNFFDIGGHSLLAVRLVAQIEQKFNQPISLSTLFHHGTIEDIAKILRQQSERRPWSCVVPIQPAGKNEPLFCVHPAGGNVLCYLELAQQLGANQPLYAFQAYGLEAEQTPYSEVAEMAQIYITAMKTVQPHGPYQIVGWSFGGPVAVEMATQLQAHHESVTFLGLFDAIAPHIVRDIVQEPEDDAQFFADYFAEADAELSLDYLRQLHPEDQIAYVIAQGRQAGIFPADVDLMQTHRLVNVYRTNMSALLRYRARLYHGRITLFQASERRLEDPTLPPEHGWQTYTVQPVEVIQVPGKHHTMMNLPHVQVLAQRLKSCLERKVMPANAVANVDMGMEQTEAVSA